MRVMNGGKKKKLGRRQRSGAALWLVHPSLTEQSLPTLEPWGSNSPMRSLHAASGGGFHSFEAMYIHTRILFLSVFLFFFISIRRRSGQLAYPITGECT